MHRLQHLRLQRPDDVADPVHAEPVHGRGVAPRLACGAVRPRESGHTSWWSALGRRAWRQPARWASAGTGLSWPKPPANWAGGWAGRPACPGWPPGGGSSTTGSPSCGATPGRGVPGERDHRRGCARPRVQRRPGGDRRPLARRRRRAQAPQRRREGRDAMTVGGGRWGGAHGGVVSMMIISRRGLAELSRVGKVAGQGCGGRNGDRDIGGGGVQVIGVMIGIGAGRRRWCKGGGGGRGPGDRPAPLRRAVPGS